MTMSDSPANDPPIDPEIEAIFDEGNAALAVGDLAAAAAKYRECVERVPTFFDGWHALGMALMKTGDLKGAIGAALMATELRPNDLLAWTALSQMYVRNGQIKEAEDAKSKAAILGIGGKIVRDA